MKKNKTLKIVAVLIPILLIGVLVYLFSNFQKKKAKVEQLQEIPALSVTTSTGTTFTQNDFKPGKKVLVYFSPTCHFCQAEATELAQINTKYPDIQWLWVASEPIEDIQAFAKTYRLDTAKNIVWAHDEMAKVYSSFDMKSVPYFLVYDAQNHLVFRQSGALKLEKLLSHFNESE